jgi:RimJ/RimL family protein N-acetyltransferase
MQGRFVELRPHREEDMAVYHKWMCNVEVNALTLFDPSPRSLAKTRQLLHRWMNDADTHSFAIHELDTGNLIGWCTLLDIYSANGSAELSIRIADPTNWNKHYGTDATIALLRYGFEELGLRKVELNAFSFNIRAIRCYQKVGFRIDDVLKGYGKRNGEDWETVVMSINRQRFEELHPDETQ